MRVSRLLAAVVLVCAGAARAEPLPALHDTSVVIDRALVRGSEATVQVSVRAATSLDASQPVAGAEVVLGLEGGKQPVTLARGKTGASLSPCVWRATRGWPCARCGATPPTRRPR